MSPTARNAALDAVAGRATPFGDKSRLVRQSTPAGPVYLLPRMDEHPPSRHCDCPECLAYFEDERIARFYAAPLGQSAEPVPGYKLIAELPDARVYRPIHPPLNIPPPGRLAMLRTLVERSRLSVVAEAAAFIVVACALVYLLADAIHTLPLWGALIWSL
jgi:hypothetical protein